MTPTEEQKQKAREALARRQDEARKRRRVSFGSDKADGAGSAKGGCASTASPATPSSTAAPGIKRSGAVEDFDAVGVLTALDEEDLEKKEDKAEDNKDAE